MKAYEYNRQGIKFQLICMMCLVLSSAAFGAKLNITITSGGNSTITAMPGSTVNYEVAGTLSDSANKGLAGFVFDLNYSGGALTPVTSPYVPNFYPPLGVTNPIGYGGTPDGNRLRQIGGVQNTFKNTGTFAPFPVGSIALNVGHNPVILALGSFVVPSGSGTHVLSAKNIIANVIRESETGANPLYWATGPAGMGVITNLTVSSRIEPPATLAGEQGFTKDRYVSFDATTNGTNEVATRITRVGGTDKYVDCTSLTDLGPDGWYTVLIDGPLPAAGDATYYCDLSGVTTGLHVRGCGVVPGNMYDIAMTTDGPTFSSVLSIPTTPPQFGAGRHQGDTVGSFAGGIWSAPDGLNSASDIVAVVQKFSLTPSAPITARVDTDGAVPNSLVTGGDILRAVNGFAGAPFGSGVTDCLTGTCVPPVGSCE